MEFLWSVSSFKQNGCVTQLRSMQSLVPPSLCLVRHKEFDAISVSNRT